MFGIRKTFRRLLGRGAAAAFNAVTAYLDNFCADESIDFHRPDSPTAENPPCIGVNKAWLTAVLNEIGTDLSSVGANKLVGTNSSSQPFAAASLLTTKPTTDKVLSVKSGGTAVSWENADRPAVNPSSDITSVEETYSSPQNADNVTWTAGGSNGYVETVLTKVEWTGTYLYGYYRIKTYDRFGRLYNVSRLKRYTIDSPVKVTWN